MLPITGGIMVMGDPLISRERPDLTLACSVVYYIVGYRTLSAADAKGEKRAIEAIMVGQG